MRFSGILLGIILIALLSSLVIYLMYGRVLIYLIGETNGLDVSYEALRTSGLHDFSFAGLSVTDRRSGLGIFSKNAQAAASLRGHDFKQVSLRLNLEEVSFIHRSTETVSSYDNLAGLVALPFKGNWVYNYISGNIELSDGMVRLDKISAVSNDIRLAVSGNISKNKNIDIAIKIEFSDNVARRMPEELTNAVLSEEGAGWKSLSVRLTGNFSKPAMQVSGKLFRLNIREVSES